MTEGMQDGEVRALSKGQERIETALIALTEAVNRKFDELGQKFVPREELHNRFTSITEHQTQQDERLTALEAGRETDRTVLSTKIDKVEALRRADRTNGAFIALSLLGVALTALTLIITHWH